MIALINMGVCDEMFEDILVSPSKHVPVCVRFIHVDLWATNPVTLCLCAWPTALSPRRGFYQRRFDTWPL